MGADKSLDRPWRKQAIFFCQNGVNFLRRLALQEKNLMTARVSMLLKSRASLTCFRACFLPGSAKVSQERSRVWILLISQKKHTGDDDNSLARPGKKQANFSIRIVWISFATLPCRKKKKLDDSSRLDVVEIARVPDVLASLLLVELNYRRRGHVFKIFCLVRKQIKGVLISP